MEIYIKVPRDIGFQGSVFLQGAFPNPNSSFLGKKTQQFHVERQELLPTWGAPIMTDETIIRFAAAQASTWLHQQDFWNEHEAKERRWKELNQESNILQDTQVVEYKSIPCAYINKFDEIYKKEENDSQDSCNEAKGRKGNQKSHITQLHNWSWSFANLTLGSVELVVMMNICTNSSIWAIHYKSLTWIKALSGRIPLRENCLWGFSQPAGTGRYKLPRSMLWNHFQCICWGLSLICPRDEFLHSPQRCWSNARHRLRHSSMGLLSAFGRLSKSLFSAHAKLCNFCLVKVNVILCYHISIDLLTCQRDEYSVGNCLKQMCGINFPNNLVDSFLDPGGQYSIADRVVSVCRSGRGQVTPSL